VAATETSRRWAEFRLSVIGNLVVGDVERGQLAAELKSLSTNNWKHPITGKRVTFGYSTISRWYYIVLNNPKARLRALSKRRCDTGIPRSLTKQVRHYLKGQATRHPSWSYSQHHKTLLQQMKERDWGRPPGYSTVQRYIRSLCSSQDFAVGAEIKRLEGLVVHLRRTLIVESTTNRLLRVPELRAKTVGPPFKFARLGPNEKTYVLSRLQDYQSTGGSQTEFCSGVGISAPSIERWRASYRRYGKAGLCPRTRRKFPNRTTALETKARVLEIFHSPPSTYAINRASWTGDCLAKALHRKHGLKIAAGTARRYLRESGYTMRRARQVLTSSDPNYRAQVEVLLQILQTLGDTETLFFIDELGPLPVKKHGGRSFVKKGESLIVPQLQTPKGSIVLAGALCATTNQMTWCYVQSKDTTAMIDLIELLFSEHQDKTHFYITWDAASWHDSISLIDWIDAFNLKTMETKEGPLITLVPLPSCSQFLNVIESVFGVMKKAVIHHSDYPNAHEMKSAISQHFRERNSHFKDNPRRAGKKIWEIDFFRDYGSLQSGNYREY
jgi:transposase